MDEFDRLGNISSSELIELKRHGFGERWTEKQMGGELVGFRTKLV